MPWQPPPLEPGEIPRGYTHPAGDIWGNPALGGFGGYAIDPIYGPRGGATRAIVPRRIGYGQQDAIARARTSSPPYLAGAGSPGGGTPLELTTAQRIGELEKAIEACRDDDPFTINIPGPDGECYSTTVGLPGGCSGRCSRA